jgi:hypothetical protein
MSFWDEANQQYKAFRPRLGGDDDPEKLFGKFWYQLGVFDTKQAAIDALTRYHAERGAIMEDWGEEQFFDRADRGTTNPTKIGMINCVKSDEEPFPFPLSGA